MFYNLICVILFQSNVATEQFPIHEDSFNDMICMWFRSSKNTSDKLFSCVTKSRVSMLGNMMESSVQVPASIFQQLQETDGHTKNKIQYVTVTMYKNSRFFPIAQDAWGFKEVTSPVVGVKLGKRFTNVENHPFCMPIYISIQLHI